MLPTPKTEIIVRGKKIRISEWWGRVYRAFFWTDLDEDDVVLFLGILGMDDNDIEKMEPKKIAEMVEKFIMGKCMPAYEELEDAVLRELEDAVLRLEKKLEAHPEIMRMAEEKKQRRGQELHKMLKELESMKAQ